jgi:anti-sigma regulatory factor (Ser/Thr protein kinase)
LRLVRSERLPKVPSSARLARRAVRDHLGSELDDGTLASVRLLVSELVTNAVEHVGEGGDIELVLGATDTGIRVEVRDPGPGFEATAVRPAAPDEPGWGLHFVSVLADRWAADRDGAARVWFEIDRRPPGEARPVR